MYYMIYSTKMTSKGTITIAAPLRKALGLKTGQRLSLRLSKTGNIVLDSGTTMEEFEAYRDKVIKNIPEHLKGLSGDALREAAAKAWTSSYDEQGRRVR